MELGKASSLHFYTLSTTRNIVSGTAERKILWKFFAVLQKHAQILEEHTKRLIVSFMNLQKN